MQPYPGGRHVVVSCAVAGDLGALLGMLVLFIVVSLWPRYLDRDVGNDAATSRAQRAIRPGAQPPAFRFHVPDRVDAGCDAGIHARSFRCGIFWSLCAEL